MASSRSNNWDDLRLILAISRLKSFASVAEALRVNKSTVIRRLAQAEDRFQTRLFDRHQGRLEPTPTGIIAIQRAIQIEADVDAVANAISGKDTRVAGTVRLTTVPILTNHLLVPALPALLDQHQGLRLEIVAEPRSLSLTNREADIALRLARPHDDNRAVTKKIGELAYKVYGAVSRPMQEQPWLSYEGQMSDLPQASWINQQIHSEADQPQILVSDAETLLACLRCGLGKTLLPAVIARRQPELAEIAMLKQPPKREVWLMVHADIKDQPRIRVVADWICSTIKAALTA